ncbi:hypothetical protein [Gordonia sp. CPCC 205333]|uniref:hypothetical protein n=1 Tax=Gordonia sp. CPCC 205333 TaxID=3140790 RepID=UPI003AF3744A
MHDAPDEDNTVVQVSANEVLVHAVATSGRSIAELAREATLEKRTIERWLAGQTFPQRRNARILLDVLNKDRDKPLELGDVWPDQFPRAQSPDAGTVEVSVYPSRIAVPAAVWIELFDSAQTQIDILVYGGTFLFDGVPRFPKLMRAAAERGVRIRFLVGDPDSEAVARRGREEEIGSNLAGRCRMTVSRLKPLNHVPGLTVQLHATPLYTSIFRGDDTLIANHHLFGAPASDNPATVVRRQHAPDLWDDHMGAYERVWHASKPL